MGKVKAKTGKRTAKSNGKAGRNAWSELEKVDWLEKFDVYMEACGPLIGCIAWYRDQSKFLMNGSEAIIEAVGKGWDTIRGDLILSRADAQELFEHHVMAKILYRTTMAHAHKLPDAIEAFVKSLLDDKKRRVVVEVLSLSPRDHHALSNQWRERNPKQTNPFAFDEAHHLEREKFRKELAAEKAATK